MWVATRRSVYFSWFAVAVGETKLVSFDAIRIEGSAPVCESNSGQTSIAIFSEGTFDRELPPRENDVLLLTLNKP